MQSDTPDTPPASPHAPVAGPGRLGSRGRGLWAPCAVLVTALLTALLPACAPPEEAATWAQREDQIVNGTREPQVLPMTPGEQLAIGYLFPTGSPGAPFCTGTLIDPRHVITARHCVEGRTAANTGFAIGHDPSGPRGTFALEAIHPHPEVDAALLVLNGDARRAAPELRPLPANRADLSGVAGQALIGQPVDVAGYGETQDAARAGRWFAQVILAEITRTFVVVDGRGRQGLCFGDS
ncbi:MAG: trypsin-like serine protease, partial [Myxococcales bacterium]|nr:trypsin-like serine protease [Myxococcales bacterium]